MAKFKIVDVKFSAEDYEQLGTREKFWYIYPPDYLTSWLFKYSRENTGEHWSEKVAEQICELLQIPHVDYELGISNERLGVITKNITPENSRMVMGNEVLHSHYPSIYPIPEHDCDSYVRVKEHTISRVLGILDRSEVLPPLTTMNIGGLNAGDVFCGYLMLDVLISNQDRHHENWAIIINNDTSVKTLCPTYDHAASLGRELLDCEIEERLTTKDKNRQIKAFVSRARSELFKLKTDKKPVKTIEAFFLATKDRTIARKHWLNKLVNLTEKNISDIFAMIPGEIISPLSAQFAIQMLIENKSRLLQYDNK